MKEKTAYLEALKYIRNARKILSSNAGRRGDYYTDSKYVKMACNTAFTGVLVALDATFSIGKRKSEGLDLDQYRKLISERDREILNHFNSAYNYLQLLGGYDGDRNIITSQIGIELAEKVIEWTKPYSNK